MLLAHSKAAAHCEPITVILAEVEAPELAALLGFVYTGSATVPRVRLEAFLRAAEALRIRLPPVPPVVMTCGERTADCKLEDVKDVKVSPKYLQCEQYPTSEGWYRPAAVSYEDTLDRKEALSARIFPSGDNGAPRGANDPPVGSAFGPACPTAAWPIDSFSHRDGATGDRPPTDRDRPAAMGRHRELAGSGGESAALNVVYQRGACLPSVAPYAEGHGGPNLLERLHRPGYEGMQPNCASVKDVQCGPIDEAGPGDFCGRTRDDCARDCPYEGGMQSSLPSECAPGRTRPYERTDYAHAGEDLSCGESCCRWRAVRRHVANRVTASPWRQIVRPHHSPRMRPVMPQRPVDDVSTANDVGLLHSSSETRRSISIRFHHGFSIAFHSKTRNCIDARRRESLTGNEYSAARPFRQTPFARILKINSGREAVLNFVRAIVRKYFEEANVARQNPKTTFPRGNELDDLSEILCTLFCNVPSTGEKGQYAICDFSSNSRQTRESS